MMRVRLSDYILASDTTQAACSVAVVHKGEPLACITEPMVRGHAEAIVPMIDHALQQAGVGMADMTRLAVTIGPGTFSGVRLGLAAMRGIAIVRQLPLIGVSSFWAMAQADPTPLPVTVSVAARSGVFYMQKFDETGAPVTGAAGDPQIVAQDEIINFCGTAPSAIVGSGAEAVSALIREAVPSTAPPWPDILSVARYAGEADTPTALPEPIYLRPPDATLPDPARQVPRQSDPV